MKYFVIMILALSLVGCSQQKSTESDQDSTAQAIGTENKESRQDIFLENADLNQWNYRNRFKIRLPKGFYLGSSIIYSSDSTKIGEIVLDYQNVDKDFSGREFLTMNEGYKIATDETTYYSDCEDCSIIKADSILEGSRKWFLLIEQTPYEGSDGDFGTWNAFQFVNTEDGKILLLTFYRMDLENLDIARYIEILKTIETR